MSKEFFCEHAVEIMETLGTKDPDSFKIFADANGNVSLYIDFGDENDGSNNKRINIKDKILKLANQYSEVISVNYISLKRADEIKDEKLKPKLFADFLGESLVRAVINMDADFVKKMLGVPYVKINYQEPAERRSALHLAIQQLFYLRANIVSGATEREKYSFKRLKEIKSLIELLLTKNIDVKLENINKQDAIMAAIEKLANIEVKDEQNNVGIIVEADKIVANVLVNMLQKGATVDINKIKEKGFFGIYKAYDEIKNPIIPASPGSNPNAMFHQKQEVKIPPELLSTFEDCIMLAWETLMEVPENEKMILLSLLATPTYSVKEAIVLGDKINNDYKLFCILYCAITNKWKEDLVKEYAKNIFINTARFSLPKNASSKMHDQYVEFLKEHAKNFVQKLLNEQIPNGVSLSQTQNDILNRKISELKQGKLTVNDSSEEDQSLIKDYSNVLKYEFANNGESEDFNFSEQKNEHLPPAVQKSNNNINSKDRDALPFQTKAWQKIYDLIKYPGPHYKKLRPENYMYNVVRAILHKEKVRCAWTRLPKEFASAGESYYYYRLWQRSGILNQIISIAKDYSVKSSPDEGNIAHALGNLKL